MKNTVLVIDDEPTIRWVLGEALRGWGYDVKEAASAAKARARFEEVRPIAVLLDINLPDGSGLDLLRHFKHQDPDVAILIVTGEVIVENTISALRGGADDFIGKPIKLEELNFALDNAIAEKRPAEAEASPARFRILAVADATERIQYLRSAFGGGEVEIDLVDSLGQLRRACQRRHELAVIDLPSGELKQVLELIRSNELHQKVPLLVDVARAMADNSIAGVLPRHRAMACTPNEIVALARRRMTSPIDRANSMRPL